MRCIESFFCSVAGGFTFSFYSFLHSRKTKKRKGRKSCIPPLQKSYFLSSSFIVLPSSFCISSAMLSSVFGDICETAFFPFSLVFDQLWRVCFDMTLYDLYDL